MSRKVLCLASLLAAAPCAWAINNSVPFVRGDLPLLGPGAVNGQFAVVGMLEVEGPENNGIDGFDGHRQSGLAGFVTVQDFNDGDPTDDYYHGTFVAGVMASAYQTFTGVAPFSQYYGAIFDGAGTKRGFVTLNSALDYLTSVAGAYTINHSWGGSVLDASLLTGSVFGESLLMDEYAGYAGKAGGSAGQYRDRLMVIAAGNDGDTTGFLGTPADSFNGLVVGALDAGGSSAWDDPLRVPLPQAAPYSSWRPLANGRAGVDLVAPGTRIWSTLAINYFGQNGLVAGTADGTSLAAPHVAGEAALLYGANATPLNGLSDKGTPLSLDHKLMKAIIMNSADKIAGVDSNGTAQTEWQPGRLVWTNDVLNAEVPLNYAVGAGMANAYEAFLQFRESSNRFWHVNTLASTGSDIYYTFSDGKFTNSVQFMTNLLGVTATLVWDRHVDYTVNTDTNNLTLGTLDKDLLSNLDLVLQKETSPGQWTNVFMSAGSLDSVEHLYVPVMPGPGNYRIGVLGTEIAEPALGEQYALAVRFYTVPEPATCGLLAFGAFLMTAGRRRRRQ